ncbi:MAG: hypothetical protein AUJ98_00460 [Bacteroidetes bacterium CG2_30_33_31]|nr:MAG: hypothetical protein AUJ98_00460 [Bacteroidetes bacterium CG2_30_33_31]
MKIFILISFLVFYKLIAFSQSNLSSLKTISPNVYNEWKTLSNPQSTIDGKWISYEISPAKGDGFLYIYDTENGKLDSVSRGRKAKFSPDGSFLAFMIAPPYDSLRQMKLRKVDKKKLPKDSLGILILQNDSLIKLAEVKNFEVADSLSNFIIYNSLAEKKADVAAPAKKKHCKLFSKKKVEAPKAAIKQEGDNIWIYFPLDSLKYNFETVDEYKINFDGKKIALINVDKIDSSTNSKIIIFNTKEKSYKTIFDKKGTAKNFSFNRNGDHWAFLFAADTAKANKVYDLYYGKSSSTDTSFLIADTTTSSFQKNYCPSENRKPFFSKDGSKLYFGIALTPLQDPKDSLLSDEKYSVDVWNYKDGLLQPQQKIMLKSDLNKTYLSIYHINTKNIVQLENPLLESVSTIQNGNGTVALGNSDKPYEREQSWDGYYADYYVVSTLDGSRDMVLSHFSGTASLSTDGNYLLYFKNTDSSWYAYDIKARMHKSLTKNLVSKFYNETNDVPDLPNSYGYAGWYNADKYVVIYDKFDLWKIDPTGNSKAVNLTNHYGRKNNLVLRAFNIDKNSKYFNDENSHWLSAFNKINKQAGLYKIKTDENQDPEKIVMSDDFYFKLQKPENANYLFWRKMNFQYDPELYISEMNFSNIRKISTTNPQQKDYLWGTVELTHWTAFNGEKLEGLIYKPADFDANKKYPMIVYFYEKYSDNIHQHYIPKPSYSTINFTEYTSNGYVVFVPDITYKIGHPARSAYNSIVSGTEFMKKNLWIDGKHIGIQGQSWGGYQVAMLVTMTNIYACAEAGAAVTNMTSAYGGIRWASGMSRAFQYEKTQSRIGYTLWDSLNLYIENSPLFFAPKVNTPLLMMHNDEDGAVPWYQGIEYFSALRRLDKKVWMLSYNNDDHNLMKWPNRLDLSIRMMQFFDYYLKEKQMPLWMSEGIPAVKKGKINGYETLGN